MPAAISRRGAVIILASTVLGAFCLIWCAQHEADPSFRASLQLGQYEGRSGVVLQQSEYDCARAVFLNLYNDPRSAAKIRIVPGKGTSMADLLIALNKEARAQPRWRFGHGIALAGQAVPFIALMRWSHYVIISKISPHSVTTIDPAIGRVRYNRTVFNLLWSGFELYRKLPTRGRAPT